jgi:chemotaxis signal transduction protein
VTRIETPIAEAPTDSTAAALRRHFDESFAAPAASRPEPAEDFLAIRVGADPYALRLSEISGLHVGVKIVPVPSPAAQLLGIVGIRGTMAPIYDLAALLRYPPTMNSRWFVVARGRQPVGFAFETFESHLQVPRASLADGDGEDPETDGTLHHTRGAVRVAGALRPIIQLASVLEMIGGKHS